jgi:hypothetical protein
MIDQQAGEVFTNIEEHVHIGRAKAESWLCGDGRSAELSSLFTDPALRPPCAGLSERDLAIMSVLLTFILGMFLAIVFDVRRCRCLPLRSLLLIPHHPGFRGSAGMGGSTQPTVWHHFADDRHDHRRLGAPGLATPSGQDRHPGNSDLARLSLYVVVVTGALRTCPMISTKRLIGRRQCGTVPEPHVSAAAGHCRRCW